MADADALYAEIGRRIREARERFPKKPSQATLAKQLNISRASIVNIEAGRQHAPLNLLWQIAEALKTDLVNLIPRREELNAKGPSISIPRAMQDQINAQANGNPQLKKSLIAIVGHMLSTMDQTPKDQNNAKTKTRPNRTTG